MVFIPIVEDGHWILYCLNLKNKKILFYDPHRSGSREATCEAINAYLMYLGIIAPSSPWPCQVLGAVDFADYDDDDDNGDDYDDDDNDEMMMIIYIHIYLSW